MNKYKEPRLVKWKTKAEKARIERERLKRINKYKWLRRLRGGVWFYAHGKFHKAIFGLYSDQSRKEWSGLNEFTKDQIKIIEDYRDYSLLQRLGLKNAE